MTALFNGNRLPNWKIQYSANNLVLFIWTLLLGFYLFWRLWENRVFTSNLCLSTPFLCYHRVLSCCLSRNLQENIRKDFSYIVFFFLSIPSHSTLVGLCFLLCPLPTTFLKRKFGFACPPASQLPSLEISSITTFLLFGISCLEIVRVYMKWIIFCPDMGVTRASIAFSDPFPLTLWVFGLQGMLYSYM